MLKKLSATNTRWRATVLAALVGCAPLGMLRAQLAYDRKPSALERGVDPAIKPGDDFFGYANGAWLKATPLPAGKEKWSARNEIDEVTRLRIAKLLDDAGTAPRGSSARKVADFRTAYLNESAIEAKGLAPIKPMLDSIAQVRDAVSLTSTLGRSTRADVDPLNWGVYQSSSLLGLSVEESIHGEKTNVAFLLQGGLGLPDRDNYLSADAHMQALRTSYQSYVARMLSLAGFDRSEQRAAAVMALETAIAKTQASRETSAVDRNADSLWTRADFARQAPGMDWTIFFAAAGMSRQQAFVPWQPSAVRGVAALVTSQPLEAWQDYLRFHLIDHYADVLPRAFANEAQAMHTAAAGSSETTPRAQRSLDAMQLAMSDALGKMYSDRYFPAEQKARVQGIVDNVKAAFARRVDAVTWMSAPTRSLALAKIKKLYVGIGYPERWQEYGDLTIDPLDAAGNLRRADERAWRHAVARLGTPVDGNEWWMPSQKVGAVLIFQLNAYDFAAALLQPPKFDPAASDAANYGAIGALIGHDVSHYVDLLGAEYDVDGGMRHWWTPLDLAQFQALADPLDAQFSGYHPFPDAAVNGKLTQSENIADLGGLTAAFDAYRRSLGKRTNDKDYIRQQDREFFLGFAQSFRSRLSDAGMRTQLTNDHAPEMYRVSTVRNMDAWYEAFDVKPGQRLYVEPGARVRIW